MRLLSLRECSQTSKFKKGWRLYANKVHPPEKKEHMFLMILHIVRNVKENVRFVKMVNLAKNAKRVLTITMENVL